MSKLLYIICAIFISVSAGSLAVPDGYYEFSQVTDLDSNKTFYGRYLYSAHQKSKFYLEDTWVNLEYNGEPLSPMMFMNIGIVEPYKYMGKDCALLNGGKITNSRIIICDSGAVMYIWNFYQGTTKTYMFKK